MAFGRGEMERCVTSTVPFVYLGAVIHEESNDVVISLGRGNVERCPPKDVTSFIDGVDNVSTAAAGGGDGFQDKSNVEEMMDYRTYC